MNGIGKGRPRNPLRRVQMLSRGCMESRFDIAGPFGLVSLAVCIQRCEDHRMKFIFEAQDYAGLRRRNVSHDPLAWQSAFGGIPWHDKKAQGAQSPMGGACGAVTFFDVTASDVSGRRPRGPAGSQLGFCTLKAFFCTLSPNPAKVGNCSLQKSWRRTDPSKRGFCAYQLITPPGLAQRPSYPHPPIGIDVHSCSRGVEIQPTPIRTAASDSAGSRASSSSAPSRWSSVNRSLGSAHASGSLYAAGLVDIFTRLVHVNATERRKRRLRLASAPPLTPRAQDEAQRSGVVFLEPIGAWKAEAGLAVLGGGLNNMLMGLAQLLTDSCSIDGGVLILPPFDSDPLSATSSDIESDTSRAAPQYASRGCIGRSQNESCATPSTGKAGLAAQPTAFGSEAPKHLLAFEDLFDLAYFRQQIAPVCAQQRADEHRTSGDVRPEKMLCSDSPPPGARIRPLLLEPLNAQWNVTRYRPMLEAVYRSVQPSARVQGLVDALVTAAQQHAGPRWAAIHLPIERDWWWTSAWCEGSRREAFTRRCWAPTEVAQLTAPARENATGTVLLYAHDKVATRQKPAVFLSGSGRLSVGPVVCHADFGARTFKLQLTTTVPYTLRNAAEQFFAAKAPSGFFGNSFSTFSKGVALMRSSADVSYAYDCARLDYDHWEARAKRGIVPSHPGFWRLRLLREHPAAALDDAARVGHCLGEFHTASAGAAQKMLQRMRPKDWNLAFRPA